MSPKELCPCENLTTRWMVRMNFPCMYDAVSIQELIFCGYLCSSPSLPFSGLNMPFTCPVSSAGVACPGQENLKPSVGKVLGEDILPGELHQPSCGFGAWYYWSYTEDTRVERWREARGLSDTLSPGIFSPSSGFLINVICACSVAQLCSTLCDPLDCRPPGSSVPCGFSRHEY